MGTGAAVFDLDRTLLPGSSLVYLGREAVRRRLISPRPLARGVLSDVAFRTRGSTDQQVRSIHHRLLRLVTGVPVERLDGLVDDVAPRVVAAMRPAVLDAFDAHRAGGEPCVVLSASPHELVAAVARLMGATAGVGTRVEAVDGVYTGHLDGEPCYGEAKVTALLDTGLDLDLSRCWAYADSASDLPLLHVVGHPVAVTPDQRLREVAEAEGWDVLEVGRSWSWSAGRRPATT